MKINKQSALILVVATAVIIILLWWINGVTYERDRNATDLAREKQTVQTWKDKEGRARAEIQTISANRDIIKDVYEDKIDSLRKILPEIGRTGKNLKEATTITTVTRDSIILKTVTDTLVVNNNVVVKETLQYSDKWLDLNYDPKTNGLNYSSRDSLSIIKFNKKQGFLKPRITTVQVISHNPRQTVTGLTQFEVKPDMRRLQFGLQAGYGFTNNGMSPYVGVGFTWKLWK